jgi:hypothetical protein
MARSPPGRRAAPSRSGSGAGPAAISPAPPATARPPHHGRGFHIAWAFFGRGDRDTLRYREDIVDGLENAPEAFIGMLEGRNFGKALVRLS